MFVVASPPFRGNGGTDGSATHGAGIAITTIQGNPLETSPVGQAVGIAGSNRNGIAGIRLDSGRQTCETDAAIVTVRIIPGVTIGAKAVTGGSGTSIGWIVGGAGEEE